jgi:hypothetical protein
LQVNFTGDYPWIMNDVRTLRHPRRSDCRTDGFSPVANMRIASGDGAGRNGMNESQS